MVTEARILVNILYLDLGGGYTGIHIRKKSSSPKKKKLFDKF